MKIKYYSTEWIDHTYYEVAIRSDDGVYFYVSENNNPEVLYRGREEFLNDFPEFEYWFESYE